ncbi:MAG: serine hydrolase [Solirubrobacterales bacterium]|nr:serine hydrolase [Solirubrobacterales bacterium]
MVGSFGTRCAGRSVWTFAIGLSPVDQGRAVDLTGLDEEFRAPVAGEPERSRRAISNPPGALDAAVVNSERWRAGEVPAINGHGTARGITGFYAALLEGTALTASLLAEATSVQTSGIDRVFGELNAFGLGFGIDENGFGMGGLGGSYGAARQDGYAIGFVTGSMGSFDRATRVENALRSCLGLARLVD